MNLPELFIAIRPMGGLTIVRITVRCGVNARDWGYNGEYGLHTQRL